MKTMKRILKQIPVESSNLDSMMTTKINMIEVSLEYSKGEVDISNYSNPFEKRGAWLHITPIEKGDKWTCYVGYSGVKQLIKPMSRFNQKQFNEIAIPDYMIQKMVDYVVAKNGIVLKT